jgi:hypothetical protein
MHVYAPGVRGYIPIDWKLDEGGPAAKRHSFEYPASEMLHLQSDWSLRTGQVVGVRLRKIA